MNTDIEKHLQNVLSTLNEVSVDHQSETQLRKLFLSEIHQQEQKKANLTVDEIITQTSQYLTIRELFEYPLKNQHKPLINQLDSYPKIYFAISFVQNLFDAIDKDQRLPKLLRHLIYQIELPLLRLIINNPELIIQARLPAIELINELIAYLVIWKDEKPFGYPTYTKLSQIIIFHTYNEDSLELLFKNLIAPIRTIREQQQKRSLVFEKRLKDTEQSAELKISANLIVMGLIEEIKVHFRLIPLTTELFESSWRQLLELDVLRNNRESFYSHLIALVTLIRSTQPINSKQDLDWLVDNIEKINQSLTSCLEKTGLVSNKHYQLTSQLEQLHIDLIEKNSHLKHQPSKDNPKRSDSNRKAEQVLRLKPGNIFDSFSNESEELTGESRPIDIVEKEPLSIIEQINFDLENNRSDQFTFPGFDKLAKQYSVTDKKRQLDMLERIKDHSVQLGNWFIFDNEEELQKLLFTNHQTGNYVFVNQNGQKSYSIPVDEFINRLNNKNIRRFKPPNLHKKAIKSTLVNIKGYLSNFHPKQRDDKNLNSVIENKIELDTKKSETELVSNNTKEIAKSFEPIKPIEMPFTEVENEKGSKIGVQDELVNLSKTVNKLTFSLQQLSVGSWLKINHKNNLIKCKMAARIASKDRYIFVDRIGKKLLELSGNEIMKYYENDLLELITIEDNNESSLADVITKTRHLKNVTR